MATAKTKTAANKPVTPLIAASPAKAKTAAKPEPVAKAKAAPKAVSKAVAKATPKAATKAAAAKPVRSPAKKPANAQTVPFEQRRNYIEVAAYHIAERRGFAPGNPLEDWVQAEAEIDRLLAKGLLGG